MWSYPINKWDVQISDDSWADPPVSLAPGEGTARSGHCDAALEASPPRCGAPRGKAREGGDATAQGAAEEGGEGCAQGSSDGNLEFAGDCLANFGLSVCICLYDFCHLLLMCWRFLVESAGNVCRLADVIFSVFGAHECKSKESSEMEDAPEIDSKIDSEQGVEATQEASEAEPAAAEDSADPGPEEPEEAIGPMKPSGPVLGQAAQEAPEAEDEGEEPKGLPEGFFDDPDMDAKMRGEEAPSKRKERELEEGLKRFEREMQAEQEKAEETRHEIDEEKYAVAAAEEEEFQVQLQSRLEKLRQQTASRKLNLPKEEEEEKEEEIDDEGEDDDDEDLALDWRAKGFS